jgi:hypothetical protein
MCHVYSQAVVVHSVPKEKSKRRKPTRAIASPFRNSPGREDFHFLGYGPFVLALAKDFGALFLELYPHYNLDSNC